MYKKILLIMRLTTVVLIATLLQVSAAGFAQKITLSTKNATVKAVLKELRAQSGYDFVFTDQVLRSALPVSLKVADKDITEVLRTMFDQQPLNYTIREKTVVISVKPARDITVSGQVLDDQGKPVEGVTVTVKSSGAKTVTDADGKFTITAQQTTDILIFSSVAMETRELPLGNRTTFTVNLTPKNTALKEVSINTGYQTIKRETSTGATVTVGSAELEKRYTPNIIDNLEGRVPGLVNYRGATTIRGVGTINASRQALVVVDGLPIEGSIANINPYDVESITVLKDAAASAIYGVRAANGIIVVTTKKAKDKRTSVEFSSDVTITDKPDLNYNLLTPSQQVDLESSYYNFFYLTGTPAAMATNLTATTNNISNGFPISPVQYAWYQRARNQLTQSQLDGQLEGLKQNDFRAQYADNALRNNLLQQYNLAVRTDGEKFQSSLVLNFKTQNTGIINAYNQQFNLFYKGTYQISKWLDVNFGVNGVLGKSRSSSSNFAGSGTNVYPYQQLLDNNGNRVQYAISDYNMYNGNPATQPRYSMLVNHLDELALDSRYAKQQNTRYFVNATAKVLPGLTFSPQFQYENGINNVNAYSEQESHIMKYLKNVFNSTPSTTLPGTFNALLPENGGKLATTNSSTDAWTARAQLDYRKTINKHSFSVIGGTEFRQTLSKGTMGLLLGYDDQLQSQSTTNVSYPAFINYRSPNFKPTFGTASLYSTYLTDPVGLIPEDKHRFNSGYAQADYSYDNKYNVSGSYRVDYADVFGLDKEFRGRPLWSAGLGWNAHNEDFLADVTWINFLKVRATYGVTGNIQPGVSSVLTANSTLTNAATNVPASVVTNAANPELRWEKTATANLGVDFSFLDNRLNGSFDWYRKKGTDLLFTKRIDPSEGFTSQIINNAGLLNNGLELSLQYSWFKPAARGAFNWSTLFVISKNNNKITYIDEISVQPLALVQGGYKIGNPVNSIYSFQYKGLNQVGQPQWLKADGTLTTVALTGADLSAVAYSGGTDPKINLALTNEVNYKGFSLNVLAVYYGGQYLRTQVPSPYVSPASGAMPSYLANSWTPTNTNTIIPGFGQYYPSTYPGTAQIPANHLENSDSFIAPGDFLTIRSLTLGYQLPQLLSTKLGSRNIRLRFQLNDPKALWVKNDFNVDPQTGGARRLTTYAFGVNFNL
ncbi:MAG: SusC/RagA family TonB-linked outer membrane protein [Bacteroidota bacterium]